MIYEYDAHGITRTAVSLYKENKNKIGEIYKATMTIKMPDQFYRYTIWEKMN